MNITKKLTAFYQHLNAADVSRTIFSVKLGEGKNGSVLKPSCKPILLSTQFHKPI